MKIKFVKTNPVKICKNISKRKTGGIATARLKSFVCLLL